MRTCSSTSNGASKAAAQISISSSTYDWWGRGRRRPSILEYRIFVMLLSLLPRHEHAAGLLVASGYSFGSIIVNRRQRQLQIATGSIPWDGWYYRNTLDRLQWQKRLLDAAWLDSWLFPWLTSLLEINFLVNASCVSYLPAVTIYLKTMNYSATLSCSRSHLLAMFRQPQISASICFWQLRWKFLFQQHQVLELLSIDWNNDSDRCSLR